MPDFENHPHVVPSTGAYDPGYGGDEDDRGIVAARLGSDGKPVYAKTTTLTTHGKAAFDTWYRDVAGTNLRVEVPLPLTARADGSYAYGREGFFPIDDGTPYATAFGNQGDAHNYSFTVEIRTVFTYRGGEVFEFRGDDDVFVFLRGGRSVRRRRRSRRRFRGRVLEVRTLETSASPRHEDLATSRAGATVHRRPASRNARRCAPPWREPTKHRLGLRGTTHRLRARTSGARDRATTAPSATRTRRTRTPSESRSLGSEPCDSQPRAFARLGDAA